MQREQLNYESGRGADLWTIPKLERYQVGDHSLMRVANLRKVEGKRFNGLEANIQPADYPKPKHTRQPLVVALGMGTDSVAMLIAMRDRGIRPDIVEWADTGSERFHTYRYVRVIQQWLKANGFPPLLIVRRHCPDKSHRSLFEQLWRNEQLPSPAFHRNHSCSVEWKLKPQRNYHDFLPWMRDQDSRTAIGFSAEETNRKVHGAAEAIGFSKDEKSRKSYQITDDAGYTTYYPLQEWNITRAECVTLIEAEGLPQPGKSACLMCPMSKKCELRTMDSEEIGAALGLEQRAEDGGKLTKARGLKIGIADKETWAEWLERDDDDQPAIVGLESDLA